MLYSVTGPGTLVFWWKASSQTNVSFGRFLVDGVEQPGKISGETTWIPQSFLLPAGPHTLRWNYTNMSALVSLTPRGRNRAGSIIRRHRLAERLFTDSLAMDSESEIEEQACKFEHILSPGATDKICSFLGHPKTCPHGAPIPPGPCCAGSRLELSTEELTQSTPTRRG